MVHQTELVLREGAPWVVDGERASRFAPMSVALVHRYAAEVGLERVHRVEYRGRPVADARVQPAAGVTSSGKPEPTSW
jgi:hypothetical protein